MSRIIHKRIEEQWLEVEDDEGFEESEEQADDDEAAPEAAPAQAPDLSGLPPPFISRNRP